LPVFSSLCSSLPGAGGVLVNLARSGRAVLVLASVNALLFVFSPFSLEPSDPEKIDALAPVQILAEGFKEPTGITVDPSGAVFVSDQMDGKVLKVAGGRVEPLVTDLRGPAGLAFDAEGRLLIVEEKSGKLLRLEDDGRLSILAEGMKKPRYEYGVRLSLTPLSKNMVPFPHRTCSKGREFNVVKT
jgi:hypothetical protein